MGKIKNSILYFAQSPPPITLPALAEQIRTLEDLVLISGLSGHETKVRDYLKKQLKLNALNAKTDILGNLICTLKGDEKLPDILKKLPELFDTPKKFERKPKLSPEQREELQKYGKDFLI